MNKLLAKNATRFISLLLIQGLVLRYIGAEWESFPYFNILIYPLFILLLPLRTPRPLVILLGFLMGISVDVFYNSLGVHASAATFTAFIRPMLLNQMKPGKGYNTNFSPTIERFGRVWFAWYSGILLFLHIFFYFNAEAFNFYSFANTWWKTIVSFIISYFLVFLIQILFKPIE